MAIAAYLEFAKRAFSREGTYRPQVFTHIGSVLLRVFLLSTLWTALYRNNGAQAGISLPAMITYATLALLLDLIYGVNGAYIIREKIREGSIAIDLMRPISVPFYVLADTVGQTFSPRCKSSQRCCCHSCSFVFLLRRRLGQPSPSSLPWCWDLWSTFSSIL